MRKLLLLAVVLALTLLVFAPIGNAAQPSPHVGGYPFHWNPHVGGYPFHWNKLTRSYPHVGGYKSPNVHGLVE